MYDESGQPTRLRVTLWRCGIWTVSALVPCLLNNIATVTAFCGCFMTPINGMLAPAILVLAYRKTKEVKENKWKDRVAWGILGTSGIMV
jgi:hypothetical protein